MKKILVKSQSKTYPVFTGNNILPALRNMVDEKLSRNIFLVIDENAAKYHLGKIKSVFNRWDGKIAFFILPSGEKVKSVYWLNKIYQSLLGNGFGRDTMLIAVGGGVTGDISGYAAATFMRGIKLVHVPTTLLACIDSSIGGKTGINFNKKKNIIGSFYQPEFVFTDIQFLSTLPRKEIISAAGEIVKYSFISGKKFYDYISKYLDEIILLEKDKILKIIYECAMIKSGVVAQDEFEKKNIRKILNLGHTFAHAIESALGLRIKHGEAVAAGVIASLYLSNKLGIMGKPKLELLLSVPRLLSLPKSLQRIENNIAFNYMYSDKKVRNGRLLFVLIKDYGKILIDVPANKNEIYYSLKMMKEFCSV
ncbi:3-dehydroquinate synthase [bacterium BMS3Abin03]|nr:3-dehydroquinate synthase [bacterium BMS3Abin03]